ncbi:MAG: hypothetical protein ACK4NW_04365 [Roseinatronobacter sp.]
MPIRYVVRTLDRPSDLADLLRYLAEFAPQIGLVVIDGSEQDIQDQNRVEIARYGDRLSVELVPIAPGIQYIERSVAGLRAITDEFIFVGADDDFPCLEFLEQAEVLIASGKVGPTDKIFGDQVSLDLLGRDHIRVLKSFVPDADDDDPMVRLRRLTRHYQPLVYGVFNREALIAELLMTGDVLMTTPQDYDFSLGERFLGAIAVARGKLHYVPGLSVIRPVKSLRHATIRKRQFPTLFLPRSHERAWNAVHHLARAMGHEFETLTDDAQQELVHELNDMVIRPRGRPNMAKNPRWPVGDALLRACFTAGTSEYARYTARLAFARDAMLSSAAELERQMREVQPHYRSLKSTEEVQAVLHKADQINHSQSHMLLDLHSMTMIVPESKDDLQARKERRLAKKQRLARKQGRGQA